MAGTSVHALAVVATSGFQAVLVQATTLRQDAGCATDKVLLRRHLRSGRLDLTAVPDAAARGLVLVSKVQGERTLDRFTVLAVEVRDRDLPARDGGQRARLERLGLKLTRAGEGPSHAAGDLGQRRNAANASNSQLRIASKSV